MAWQDKTTSAFPKQFKVYLFWPPDFGGPSFLGFVVVCNGLFSDLLLQKL